MASDVIATLSLTSRRRVMNSGSLISCAHHPTMIERVLKFPPRRRMRFDEDRVPVEETGRVA